MFKMYDFDNNNFLTRDEIVYLMRTYTLASKKPVVSNDIERKTDDFIKNADLDMDRRISLKEFQSYLGKNRDIFVIFDNYSALLTNNPMGATVTSLKKNHRVDEEDAGEEAEEDPFGGGGDQALPEMDEDLMNELQKDKDGENRSEEANLIKQGVEFNVPPPKKEKKGIFEEEEAVEGDQFGALKPWITNLVHTVPSNYKPSNIDGTQPNANLDLEFVHGYRCHDTRNNLRYTADGNIVYHTAAVGIHYNKESHTQQFFFDHIDDITALAIHPNKKYVATGEIGPYPLIAVWDSDTMKPLAKFTGPLQKGINHLAFSKDGRYLVATAADDDHNVAIYDWEKGNATADLASAKGKQRGKATSNPIVAAGKGTRANILGACFNNNGDTVALTCVKEVNFISFAGGKFAKKKATGLRGDQMTTIMCGAYVNNTLVCGSFKGNLITFAGASFSKAIKAHSSCCNTIYLRDNNTGFMTGGNDGLVLVFDTKFAITMKYDIKGEAICSLNPRVRSVCESESGEILIGSRGGDIIEFSGQNPTVLLRGHFDLELWGLCIHPKKSKYLTIGQDKMLALWDVPSRKIEKYTTIPEPAEFIHISPDGKDLAIGSKSGTVHIYDAITFEKKLTKSERKGQPIGSLKYSPDGQYLAVGGVDSMLFIYNVKANYKRAKKLIGHTSRVTHIDWSEDSEVLQSTSTSYELLYHSVSQGSQITTISSLRDTEWYSWSCVFGWPVQGIWPPCASGDDINSVDRDKRKKLLVTADDFGKVKLFRYPSPVDKASHKSFFGHSSHVTSVKFLSPNANANNTHVISTGGNDKAIFQWKLQYEDEAEEEAEDLENINEGEHIPEDEEGAYFKEEEMGATEFGAVKPWLGELKASIPRNYKPPKNAHLPPTENLKKLRYVFGYRAFDTRMNIKYTADPDKIVYHAAALGIVLDKSTNTQNFFTLHGEDIVALAIHPNKQIVATGQMAKKKEAKLIDLYVWDVTKLPSETNCEVNSKPALGKEIRNLKGCHLRAIRMLQFSPDGTKLLSGGQDDDNSVAVHDWDKSQLIVKTPVDKARVLDAVWTSNEEFVTVGPKHIKFFTLNGRTINVKKGVFGKSIQIEPLISVAVAFENKSIVTGTSMGNLIVWMGGSAIMKKELCKGPVYSLYPKNNLLYAGGFDGVLSVFTNSKLAEKKEAKIDVTQMTRCDPGIRSIDINEKNNILLGTKGGDIIEIANKTHKILMNSHAEEELWGLTVNPINPYQVASGGGDKSLRIWDIRNNKQLKFWMCDQDFRALDWSKDGKFIVIGTMEGKIYYIDVSGDKCQPKGTAYQSIFKGPKQWIQELKICPDNKYAAYGSHCGVGASFSKIEVLNITGDPKCPFSKYVIVDPKITSALTHLDWDVESDVIVCNSLAFELKYVSITARKRIDASAARDREWDTWTCLFGFPVQGIWPPEATGYIVNYTCMSNNKKLIATGDDFSLVKLFRSPCTVEKAGYKAYGGHSSHVPKIRFSAGDSFLISVGGNDKCVFVWETDFGQPIEEAGDIYNEEEEVEANEENEEEYQDDLNEGENMEMDDGENMNMDEEYQDEDQMDEAKEEKPHQEEEEVYEEEEEPEPEPEPPKKKSNKASVNSKTQPAKNTATPSKTTTTKVAVQNKTQTQNRSQNNSKTTTTKGASTLNASTTSKKERPIKPGAKNKMTFDEEDFGGDQAGVPGEDSNEPWRSVLDPPDNTSTLPKDLKNAPKLNLNLDFVFGYRTKDTRNNLAYLSDKIVAYHAGAMGIIMNLETKVQTYFTGHKQDILAFAIDSSRKMIATGEISTGEATATICIWDKECREMMRFEGLNKGVNVLSFSPNGTKLIAVTMDESHTIHIFDLKEKKLVASKAGDNYKILDACFKNEKDFVTVGIKHYKYWMVNGPDLLSKEGVFGQSESNKIDNKLGLVKLNNNRFITGSATGEVTIWDDEKIVIMKKCHMKNVDCIYSKDNFILTGGRDHSIVVSDKDLAELRRISLDPSKIDSVFSVPRSIEMPLNGTNKILLGTLSSEIFELVFESGSILYGDYKAENYLSSHYSSSSNEPNEINGLVYLPKKDLFVSVSEDSTLRFWDMNENKQMGYFRLDVDNNGQKLKNSEGLNLNKALCVDVNSHETHLVIGFIDGSVRLYSIEDEFLISKIINCRSTPCTDIKYSPNGVYVAVAFKEGVIEILKTEDFSKTVSLDGHTTPVSRIDWSEDSSYLSSTSINGELNFYNVKKGTKIIRTSDLRNEEWASWTRVYGWPVQGLWDNTESPITACERSKNEIKGNRLLAAGGESGLLKIYKYPCISGEQMFLSGKGHGQKISNIKFTDSSNVLLTSSADGCICKWTLS